MKKEFLKIYIYPLIVLLASWIPWYLFARFVLKIDMDKFILQSFGGTAANVKGFKIFFVLICVTIYVCWVFLNNWKKKDPERRLAEFFISYGKIFALIISIQLFIFMALLLL